MELDFRNRGPVRLDFLRRFRFDAMNNHIYEVERDTTNPLMEVYTDTFYGKPKLLSNIAKVDDANVPLESYDNELPALEISAALIMQHQGQQPTATGEAGRFPFKLKAVGAVDGMLIYQRAGQPGTVVSRVVQMVP